MEKNLTERLFEALESIPEFKNESLDAQGELILNIESKLRVAEDFPKGKASEGIMFLCGECLCSSKGEPVCGPGDDESFICAYCGAETTYFEDGSSSCRSKEDVGKYRIKVICGKCQQFLDYTDTELPEMDGMISHSLCADCGRAQLDEIEKMMRK